ncbi:hypothetical protein WR25_14869 [Diploscapter pachys]|uniref:G-protein coupled receptors family 1 profile domain-containing protein n=1 Tax=Diploscapter pachys TaxID=2018661 RepID=A0A2A2KNG5_9BILA|nr:hypothetical protein WR25_14869 [Diploscapter pachys]
MTANCLPNTTCDTTPVADTSSNDYLTTDQIIEIAIYIFCFALAAPLNVISLHKTFRAFRAHKAKSPILLLRINLNIADIMTIFLFVPKQVIWILTYGWYGGELLCKIMAFFATFSFYLNSFVIACIAIDRVYGAYNISSLTAHRKSYIRCRTLLACGWLLAFILSIPQVLIFRLFQPFPGSSFKQCTSFWKEVEHVKMTEAEQSGVSQERHDQLYQEVLKLIRIEQVYSITHLMFLFWLPCLVIIGSYLTVLCILQGHLKNESRLTPPNSLHLNEDSFANVQIEIRPENGDAIANGSTARLNTRFACSKEDVLSTPESTPVRIGSLKKKQHQKIGALSVTTIHKAKQHAKRQATWIILAYLLIWSPYNVFTLLNMTGAKELLWLKPYFINLSFLHAAMCANPIANPLIYGVFQRPNRK